MNREIKFRAWDKELERICEVIKINFLMKTIIVFHPDEEEVSSYLPLTRFELMQYTGLKDKNGKEIYEGDIISTDLDRPFNIVVFRNGAFMFQCHDNGKDYYDYMFSVDEESDRWEYGEVIGNIHDNPELITP